MIKNNPYLQFCKAELFRIAVRKRCTLINKKQITVQTIADAIWQAPVTVGQKVPTAFSEGGTVAEVWSRLFFANELLWEKRKNEYKGCAKILDDIQITEQMHLAFPHREPLYFSCVGRARTRYNKGELTFKELPKMRSRKYIRQEDGRTVRV